MTAVFPMDAGADPSMRRAALALYATSREDREWVLAQLPGADRPLLEQMLRELAALGLPPEPAMVRSVLAQPQPRHASEQRPPVLDLDRLDAAGVAALAALLEHEPARLAACVVALLAPPRRVALLDALSAPQRRQVQTALDRQDAPAGARLKQAVLQELAARLPAPARPLSAWRRWMAARAGRGGRS